MNNCENAKKTLHIIPHSHWDREWYLPFEKHRLRLVKLMDTLIELMEGDPSYSTYHLDGQMIVIEDYLAIRPQMRERLLALIRAGRIRVGPWYVLQDEYLTGGEANVRNMLVGLGMAKELGVTPEAVGYFPDAFGNVSQAPQILRGFGIDSAVFGRGMNDVLSDNQVVKDKGLCKSELVWESPDGSSVMAVYMANWYHNAMELPTEKEALRERLDLILSRTSRIATTDHLLGMNGCDHQPVQTDLRRAIDLANELYEDVSVVQSGFAEYLAAIAPSRHLFPKVTGEINGQFTKGACPLICTASAHVDVKVDNYGVEHLLARIAEPLCTVAALGGAEYPRDEMLYAWKTLMQNHPHDSICTCSVDEVYDEMKVRFAKARAVGEALRDEALFRLCPHAPVAGEGDVPVALFSLDGGCVRQRVRFSVDFAEEENVEEVTLLDGEGNEIPATYRRLPHTFTYRLPDDAFRKVTYVTRFEIEADVKTHGIGVVPLWVRRGAGDAAYGVDVGEMTVENGVLRLAFSPDGTFALTDLETGETFEDLGRLEDTRDVGNLYNYVQAQGDAPITSRAREVRLLENEATHATVRIFQAVAEDLSAVTDVTLRAGARRVEMKTTVKNERENHRLRMLFPTRISTDTVRAEGQFDLVKRDIAPSPLWENPCNAQRMQAFVTLESPRRSFLVATRGLAEYEVLRDGDNTLALTLLRAVGEVGDWGVFPTPKGQKKGEWTVEYALVPYADEKREAYAEGYSFAYPSAIASVCETAVLPRPLLSYDEPFLRLSAFKMAEDGDGAALRLFSVADEEISVSFDSAFCRVVQANLAEEEEGDVPVLDGKFTLTVPPHRIVTLRLR